MASPNASAELCGKETILDTSLPNSIIELAVATSVSAPYDSHKKPMLHAVHNKVKSMVPGCAGAVTGDDRCKGVRGDNPYRRKWNPRLAAAHRREVECAKAKEKQEKEVTKKGLLENTGPTLAEYFHAKDDAEAEAEMAAARAEAATAEAQATALAEYAAASNLADERSARQQESTVYTPTPVSDSFAGFAYRQHACRPSAEAAIVDESDLLDLDPRSGFSVAAPRDRGPEHRPGSRGIRSQRCLEEPAPPSLPAPFSQPVALGPVLSQSGDESPPPWPEAAPARSQRTFTFGGNAVDSSVMRPVRADRGAIEFDEEYVEHRNAGLAVHASSELAEGMDFGQLQQLISRGIASAEAGHEPDLDLNAMPIREASVPRSPHERCSPVVAPPQASAVEARRRATEIEPQDTAAEAPRRAMAEIRAAAERRAYCRVEEPAVQPPPEDLDGALANVADSRKSMSAIRAIAERRSCGFRSAARSSTPRDRSTALSAARHPSGADENPEQGEQMRIVPMAPLAPPPPAEPLKCGGAYRPSHVYSGRSGNGGTGLSDTLGLKYGQPPPGRVGIV